MISIVVVGLAAIDGSSIILAKLQIGDSAEAAAAAAAEDYASSHNIALAKEAAISAAHSRDPDTRVAEIHAGPGGLVTVTVRKRASTLFLQRIGFLRHFAVVKATASASP